MPPRKSSSSELTPAKLKMPLANRYAMNMQLPHPPEPKPHDQVQPRVQTYGSNNRLRMGQWRRNHEDGVGVASAEVEPQIQTNGFLARSLNAVCAVDAGAGAGAAVGSETGRTVSGCSTLAEVLVLDNDSVGSVDVENDRDGNAATESPVSLSSVVVIGLAVAVTVAVTVATTTSVVMMPDRSVAVLVVLVPKLSTGIIIILPSGRVMIEPPGVGIVRMTPFGNVRTGPIVVGKPSVTELLEPCQNPGCVSLR